MGSSTADDIDRGGSRPTVVERQPLTSSSGTFGTLRFTTTGSAGGLATSEATTAWATAAAVSHCWLASISSHPWPSTPKPATLWLTATPLMPPLRAVRAAPTVPEW